MMIMKKDNLTNIIKGKIEDFLYYGRKDLIYDVISDVELVICKYIGQDTVLKYRDYDTTDIRVEDVEDEVDLGSLIDYFRFIKVIADENEDFIGLEIRDDRIEFIPADNIVGIKIRRILL